MTKLVAFLGRKGSILEVTSSNLKKALLSQEPAVAGTFFQPAVLPPGSDKWYAPRHAYTVVRFDASTDTITLRNPWGISGAGADGVFSISLKDFVDSFQTLTLAANFANSAN